MATHDYVIANGTGAAVRSDLNDALAAIVSNNSSSSEPATTYAYQWWADTTANVLKIRNSANNAWITLRELDGTLLMEDGSNSAPGLSFASDTNTGFFSGGADKIGFATGGVERLEIGSSEVVFNDPSNDVDFRVESNGNTHMLFVDAGNDRIGVGTNSPAALLDVADSSGNEPKLRMSTGTAANFFQISRSSSTGHYTLASEENGSSIILATDPDSTGAVDRLTVDRNGNVGIGVTAPSAPFHIDNPADTSITQIIETGNAQVGLVLRNSTSTGNNIQLNATGNDFRILTNASEAVRIDGSGRLLLGTSSARANFFNSIVAPHFQIEGAGDTDRQSAIISSSSNAAFGSVQILAHQKSGAVGGNTLVSSGDSLGLTSFQGSDGAQFVEAARIESLVDGTPGSNDMPGRLVFSTTADGASSPTERVRIDSSGHVKYYGNSSSAWLLSPASDVSSYSQLDAHFPASNRTLFFNENSSNDSYVVWNRNSGSSGKGFGLEGQNFKVVQGASEHLRVDSSGRLLVGLTSPNASTAKFEVAANVGPDPAYQFTQTASSGLSYDLVLKKQNYSPDDNSSRFLTCADSTADRLHIKSDGDVLNHDNSYGSLSDVSLKQQIVDASSQWDDIKDVRVRKFKMNSDVEAYGDEAGFRIGVIAQELEQTSPGLVKNNAEPDGTILKSVSYSVLYMKAIKALQEAQTRIETLESQHADLLARVAALEAG